MPNSINIDWNIESIRVTGFHRGSFNTRSLESWLETVSENEPIQVNKTGQSFDGVSRSPDGFIRVNWNGNRFDVRLTPEQPALATQIAPFTEVQRLFVRYVDAVPRIENLPIMDRIALGVVLTASVENEEQGMELLRPAICGLNVDPRVRDFLYRANYPFESQTIIGTRINHLATWSVGQLQTVKVQIGPDGSQTQETVDTAPMSIRLDLDFSTDQFTSLEADSELLARLLTELGVQVIDFANNGESVIRG